MQSNNEKLDRRRAYSQRAIQKALKTLMDTMPLHKITVTDICREANVNRTTFYANYADLQALLHSISRELDDKIRPILSQYETMDGMSYYTALVETLGANAEACLTVMRISEREFLGSDIDFSYSNITRPWQMRTFNHASALADLMPEYILAGTRAVINGWLERDRPFPSELIAEYLYTINDLLIRQLIVTG